MQLVSEWFQNDHGQFILCMFGLVRKLELSWRWKRMHSLDRPWSLWNSLGTSCIRDCFSTSMQLVSEWFQNDHGQFILCMFGLVRKLELSWRWKRMHSLDRPWSLWNSLGTSCIRDCFSTSMQLVSECFQNGNGQFILCMLGLFRKLELSWRWKRMHSLDCALSFWNRSDTSWIRWRSSTR